ncbi:hypothetical protein Q9L58_009250, partial [Maublancomyces gigas]
MDNDGNIKGNWFKFMCLDFEELHQQHLSRVQAHADLLFRSVVVLHEIYRISRTDLVLSPVDLRHCSQLTEISYLLAQPCVTQGRGSFGRSNTPGPIATKRTPTPSQLAFQRAGVRRQ